jgi:hypothetical protein
MNHPNFTCNHINQKQLADRWDLSERTLERWRAIGWGPLFHKNRWSCGLPHSDSLLIRIQGIYPLFHLVEAIFWPKMNQFFYVLIHDN